MNQFFLPALFQKAHQMPDCCSGGSWVVQDSLNRKRKGNFLHRGNRQSSCHGKKVLLSLRSYPATALSVPLPPGSSIQFLPVAGQCNPPCRHIPVSSAI